MTFEYRQKYDRILAKRLKDPTDQLRRHVLANVEESCRARLRRNYLKPLPLLGSPSLLGRRERRTHEDMLKIDNYVWHFAVGRGMLSHLRARSRSTKTAKAATPLPANSLVAHAWPYPNHPRGAGNKARRKLRYLLYGEPAKRERVQQTCGCWLYNSRQKHTCNSNT